MSKKVILANFSNNLKKVFIFSLIIITVLFYFSFLNFMFFNNDYARASWGNNYLSRNKITIDNTKVSGIGDLNNFTVLISTTTDFLKTKINGGKVENDNGYDIVFMPESSTSTILDYEIEKYSSTTGELIAWVKLPILHPDVDTSFYIYYENANIEFSQESVSDLWGSDVKGVWHLDDSPVGQMMDSTIYNNDGTSVGSMTFDDKIIGKIGDAISFDGTDDYINFGNNLVLNSTSSITISAWIRGSGNAISSTVKRNILGAKNPLVQIIGNKAHYTWIEENKKIYTGEMNINGNSFVPTLRIDTLGEKGFLDFQATANGDYYVWTESDGDNMQIWTGFLSSDGMTWQATQRTINPFGQVAPSLQVVGNIIYYVWYDDAGYDIWTATMNINGTDWSAVNKTNSPKDRRRSNPQLQVVGDIIYYAWTEIEEILNYHQIAVASMNTDGTGFNYSIKTANESLDYGAVDMQVSDGIIYYTWVEDDYFKQSGAVAQIWTGKMNINGTGFSSSVRNQNLDWRRFAPKLQVVGDKINYVWYEFDGLSVYKAKYAISGLDGLDWSESSYLSALIDPSFQVVGGKSYYFWSGPSGENLITGSINSNIINKGDSFGFGVFDSKVKSFINAGVDGIKYKKQAVNDSSGVMAGANLGPDWIYLSLTYDKNSLKVYLNGSLEESVNYSEDISTTSFDLLFGDGWDGEIDEVQIYNNARTSEWITTTYNNQSSPNTFYSIMDNDGNQAPYMSVTSIDEDASYIILNEGATSSVVCSASVGDANGYSNIDAVSAKFYRSGVESDANDDKLNHYTLTGGRDDYCSGDGDSGVCSFDFDVYYFAEPTDISIYELENWVCVIEIVDETNLVASSSDTIEMNTLQSLDVTETIDYGNVFIFSDSVGDNITTITNSGNVNMDFSVAGAVMNCETGSIPVSNFEYKLDSFSYGGGTSLEELSVNVNANLPKAVNISTTSSDNLYWQMEIDSITTGTCSSTLIFTAVEEI